MVRIVAMLLLLAASVTAVAAAEVGIEDVAAVPHLKATGRAAYEKFLLHEFNRVFALAPNGAYAHQSRRTTDVETLAAKTLDACQKHAKDQPCRIYAVNNRVVWNRKVWDNGTPAPLPTRPGFGELRASDLFPWRGPQAARGAVVWSHGKAAGQVDSRWSPIHPYIRRFATAGFDIVRFDRDPQYDSLDWAERRLVESVGLLRAAGYRQVIVAGQSRGGWHSLLMLRHPGAVDGVLATAPAMHGTWQGGASVTLNGLDDFKKLVRNAEDRRVRVALVVFTGDDFDPDPGARAAYARSILEPAGTPLLVIDRPDGITGHGGGGEPAFDARYGDCLVRFLTADRPGPACR